MRRPILSFVVALGAGVLSILTPSCSCGGPGSTCERTTCLAAGANCGQVDDGCGGKLDCGFCGGGMTCGGGGTANVCGGGSGSCTPITCGDARATCGIVPDGCGGQLHCGYCGAGQTCGGAGTAWQCGLDSCTPTTCAAAGANCGRLPDGCGGYVDCGACAGSDTCGGGGTPNVCGAGDCIPTGSCGSNDCGFVSDGCGAALDCGGCAGTQICRLGATCVGAPPGSVGGSCAQGSDCLGGVCLTPSANGWPGGYCSAWCTTDDDCGTGNVCAEKNGAGRGVCVAGCTTTADCGGRAGYACSDLGFGKRGCTPSGTGSGGVGDPCTSVADCSGGQNAVCVPAAGGMPGGYCTVTCGSAGTSCPSGSHCGFGTAGSVCVKSCTSTADCRSGYTCSDWDGDGTPECVASAPAGAPCTQDSDCGAGKCLTQGQTGWSGGYCTTTCASDSDCSTGSQCVTDNQGVHRCLASCQTNQDCRNGYACVADPTTSGAVCEPYGGGTGGIGDPCTSVADCSGGTKATCTTDTGGYPGGYCSTACASTDQCPSGSACVSSNGGTGNCEKTCSADTDCRTGYTCQKDSQGNLVCSPGGISSSGGDNGAACTDNSQCTGHACRDELHSGWKGGYCYAPCRNDSDCGSGSHCGDVHTSAQGFSAGECFANCSSNADCRTGYTCWDTDGDGKTECAPEGSGSGAVGDPCTTIDQCANGASASCVVNINGYPKGYCTTSCSNSQACPGTAHCTHPSGDAKGFCLAAPCCSSLVTCTYDSNNDTYSCPQGMHCTYNALNNFGHYCAYDGESCDATHACPDGHECSGKTSGHCLVCANGGTTCRNDYDCYDLDQNNSLECWPAAKGSGAVGSPCTRIRDCDGGVHGTCLFEDKGSFPGGMCVHNCTDGTACPSGTACINLTANAPAGTQTVKVCLPRCSSSSQCRQGYSCMKPDPNDVDVCYSTN